MNVQRFVLAAFVLLLPVSAGATTSADSALLRSAIKQKIDMLGYADLRSTNDFLNSLPHLKVSTKVRIVLLKMDQFPPFLDTLFYSHQRLRFLPRDPETLVALESERAPGVFNVYVEVPAQYVPPQDVIYNWIPDPEIWLQHVDMAANDLSGKTPKEAFLTLFWLGNKDFNPEIIEAIEGKDLPPEQQWQWNRMVHPMDTKKQKMYIPIATFGGDMNEFFKK